MKPILNKISLNNARAITLVIVLFTQYANAQDFKLAGIYYNNYQKSEINNDTGNQEISFQEFGAFVNFPKPLKNNKTIIVNGVGYGFIEALQDETVFPNNENSKVLHSVYYQFTLIHQWNQKWGFLVNLKPTLASDFEAKLSSDDFVFQGAVSVIRKFSDRFKLGGGLAYSARFGSPQLVPLVSLNYKNNKHEINALLPVNVTYKYAVLPSDKLHLGLKYSLNGANFNVHSADNTIDKINYSRANVGILAEYSVTKMLRIEAFGGISTRREYGLEQINGNRIEIDSNTASFFSIGLVLVPFSKK